MVFKHCDKLRWIILKNTIHGFWLNVMQVHDYVRSYLGETKASTDFAKQFLEKRSHYKNKAKQQQKEEEVCSNFERYMLMYM